MAQLMTVLRTQFRQRATRGLAVLASRSVTTRSILTTDSNFLQCSPTVVRHYLQGHYRQFCNKPPADSKQTPRWWWTPAMSGLFGTTFLALLTAVGMYFENQRNKLAHVNDQLAKLYGPLYGNRQATRRIYKKVLSEDFYKEGRKDYTLQEYLEEARRRWVDSDEKTRVQGRRMLTRWRRFLLTIIHPLDEEAEKIIRANAHLIEDNETNADVFSKFVVHVNYEKFIVAKWMDRDFVVGFQEKYREKDFDIWNNTGTMDIDPDSNNVAEETLLELEKHVNETYKELVKRQKKLMGGLKMEGKKSV
ncbi:uncharacterized protein LOC144869019 [Branchiostoma floridae x Branchiostoma japonicum]